MMDNNPMVKPHVATTSLVVTTSVAAVCLIAVVAVVIAGRPPATGAWTALAVVSVIAALLLVKWYFAIRRKNRWTQFAHQQWQHLAEVKGGTATTAEISILDFHDVQPTGAWATIRWEKFGYIQPAWIENCSFAIWPGSVLLVRPDPVQIRVGAPWPQTYYVRANQCLAIAPALIRP